MSKAIKLTRGGSFVPEWGNESRAEADKIRIDYRFLTFAEQQELLDPAELGKSFAYESRILGRMIERVHNLTVEIDGKEVEVADGQALVSTPGLDELAMEAWVYLRKLSAVDKKK